MVRRESVRSATGYQSFVRRTVVRCKAGRGREVGFRGGMGWDYCGSGSGSASASDVGEEGRERERGEGGKGREGRGEKREGWHCTVLYCTVLYCTLLHATFNPGQAKKNDVCMHT